MNQRNVEAIRAILDEIVAEIRRKAPVDVLVGDYQNELLAEILASRGVLVPASLTDEEAERAVHGGPRGYEADWEATPEELRAELERLARGEPPEGERPR